MTTNLDENISLLNTTSDENNSLEQADFFIENTAPLELEQVHLAENMQLSSQTEGTTPATTPTKVGAFSKMKNFFGQKGQEYKELRQQNAQERQEKMQAFKNKFAKKPKAEKPEKVKKEKKSKKTLRVVEITDNKDASGTNTGTNVKMLLETNEDEVKRFNHFLGAIEGHLGKVECQNENLLKQVGTLERNNTLLLQQVQTLTKNNNQLTEQYNNMKKREKIAKIMAIIAATFSIGLAIFTIFNLIFNFL